MRISEIAFDGSKIIKASRDGSNLSITVELVDGVKLFQIIFNSLCEEKAELFKNKEESIVNTYFPPLDVIETFKENNGKYQFSGYLNREPWSVWEFKASSYVIS